MGSPSLSQPSGTAPPRRVGAFELLGVIGRGGMGAVHLARRAGQASPLFALKALRHGVDADAHAALVEEGRIASAIRDTHVVPVLDSFEAEGELFLVMPYVRGLALSEVLSRVRGRGEHVPLTIAVGIAVEALRGLHAAHTARDASGAPLSVVHRDVSPHNVHVGLDGVCRILDFGIAKAHGRSQQTTQQGLLKGKMAYMAHEQIHGEPACPKTDVYALGVCLWETVAGRRLFAGSNDVDTLRRVLEQRIPPLWSVREGAPGALDDVVRVATHSDRTKRYASAEAMALALEAAVKPASTAEVSAFVTALGEREVLALETRLIGAVAAPPGLDSVSAGLALGTTGVGTPREPAVGKGGMLALVLAGLCLFAVLMGLAVRPARHTAARPPIPEGPPALPSAAPSASVAKALPSPSAQVVPSALPSSPRPRSTWVLPPPPPRAKPSASVPPSKSPCEVPTYIDEHGHKRHKPECLDP